MSIESWRKEYLPMPFPDTIIGSLKHSIRKWEGLNRASLMFHGLGAQCGRIYESINELCPEKQLFAGDITCALCQYVDGKGWYDCHYCPLGTCSDEWMGWYHSGNTAPMLTKLRAALRREQRKARAKRNRCKN